MSSIASRNWTYFTATYSNTNYKLPPNVEQFIMKNTEVSDNHLTPQIRLRLFTPRCRFWYERPELWPSSDPYWAIYWPGGQAIARYILDYPDVVKCKSVLDIGSGCGASAIAAQMSGASQVVANDIDPVAEIAIRMNCLLNNVKPFPVFTSNIIGTHLRIWDLILLGDMFYDEELSESLQTWLKKYISVHETLVLIGDPGRPHFISHSIFKQLQKVAEYELPETTREQNYGLTRSCVWKYQP